VVVVVVLVATEYFSLNFDVMTTTALLVSRPVSSTITG